MQGNGHNSETAPSAGENDSRRASFRLKTYYYSVETVGFVAPVVVGLAALFLPQYFGWLSQYSLKAMIVALLAFGILDASFLVLHEVTGKNFFFNINRYLFVGLFIYMIAMSGGVNSSLTFLLIFPFIVSLVYLDKKMTRNVGILLSVLFALVIFANYPQGLTTALVIKHIVQTVLVATISFLMYRIVVETLATKYEKENAAHRLAELINIDRLKADFLSVAQHRLRTPLSGIRWALESLADDTCSAADKKDLIIQSLNRIKDSIAIVNEMLRTAEGAAGDSLALNFEPTDLAAMLKTMIKELSFVAVKNENKVTTDMPDKLMVSLDPKKAYPALSNIIDNACRYTRKGTIFVSLKDSGDSAIVVVRDSGIGISKDDMGRLFDRLFRGSNAIALEPDESGVGLYVSKKIIELHGGGIVIDSVLAKGTTVTVTLPLRH